MEHAQEMTRDEYRAGLDSLGVTQEDFGRMVGATPRSGQRWALGESRIPGAVAILLRLMVARPELKPVIEDFGAPPVRSRAEAQ